MKSTLLIIFAIFILINLSATFVTAEKITIYSMLSGMITGKIVSMGHTNSISSTIVINRTENPNFMISIPTEKHFLRLSSVIKNNPYYGVDSYTISDTNTGYVICDQKNLGICDISANIQIDATSIDSSGDGVVTMTCLSQNCELLHHIYYNRATDAYFTVSVPSESYDLRGTIVRNCPFVGVNCTTIRNIKTGMTVCDEWYDLNQKCTFENIILKLNNIDTSGDGTISISCLSNDCILSKSKLKPYVVPTPISCTDSDNGKDNYDWGYVLLNFGTESLRFRDYCTIYEGFTVFNEMYCDENNKAQANVRSVSACPARKCTDSDSGFNYFKSGSVNMGGQITTDSCSGNVLTEGYCENDALASATYTCPLGCSNGACSRAA